MKLLCSRIPRSDRSLDNPCRATDVDIDVDLQETEHFSRLRQQQVAKIGPYGLPRF
jgi:hypothetical protein